MSLILSDIQMSIDKPIRFVLPEELAKQIGERAKSKRLAMNLTLDEFLAPQRKRGRK
jgi:hypothetical protein